MSTNTPNMALGQAVNSDNANGYLITTLAAALTTIDGHRHGNASNSGLSALQLNTGTALANAGDVRVNGAAFTYRDNSGPSNHTLAALDVAQTWSAVQTYSAGISADASHTLTLPSVTDTVAVLGTAQTFTAKQTYSGQLVATGRAQAAAGNDFSTLFINPSQVLSQASEWELEVGGGGVVNNGSAVTNLGAVAAGATITINVGGTVSRLAQLWATTPNPTISGTLTNHNALYLATPSGGATVRVIDTASGAYLTTGGTWTNNPSWAALKEGVTDVQTAEMDGWLDWLAGSYRPVWYRYKPRFDDAGKFVSGQQDYEYDHFGFLLDDMPDWFRQAVCSDEAGGISTKDTEGLLLAMVSRLAARLKEVEGKVAA